MSKDTKHCWDALTAPVTPPPWKGPSEVHTSLDAEERAEEEHIAAVVAAGKRCTKCGQTFPASTEYFYGAKCQASGLRPECKECWRKMPSSGGPG